MDILVGFVGLVGSLLLLAGAFFAAAYAYRVVGENEKPKGWFWSGVAALLVSLVFARAMPLFFFVFALLTVGVFAGVSLIDRVVTQRARIRRRETFLKGRDL